MFYQTIASLRKQLIDKNISAVDLTQRHLDRIDALNSSLNAIVIDNRTDALEQAKLRDKQLSSNQPLGALHGIPITIKEAFDIKGLKTTVNFPPLKNNVATQNSVLVERLREAGAIILGKTNVPTMLSDTQTFGPLYPTCNNPFDTSRIPGGSTGGGAAAVASGMSCFEIGSDIGGSIRSPAHYCGLFGLKPTHNGHHQDGHTPPLPNKDLGFSVLNCTGPLARTVEDLKIAYDIAYTPRWDYLQYLSVTSPGTEHKSLKGYKIGWYDHLGPHTPGKETRAVLAKAAKTLSEHGAKVEKISIDADWTDRVFHTWATLFGLHTGQDFNWFIRQLLKFKFKNDVKGSSLNLSDSLNKGLSLDFMAFSKALREQQECTAEFSHWFDEYDFILSPTAAGPAFKHNPKHKPIEVDGETKHYAEYCFLFVMPFNVTGNPVLVVPGQSDPEKLPIGIQCIGRQHSEQQLLHFGHLLEDAGFCFRAPVI